MAAAAKAGVEYVEIGISGRGTVAEIREKALHAKRMADEAGLKVWSCHLPFSRKLDISVLNDSARMANLEFLTEMIAICGEVGPEKLVLHPSSEPIADGEREQRIRNSIASIGILRREAARIGAQLCIEDLPRTCLGRNSAELLRIIAPYPEEKISIDTHHLQTNNLQHNVEANGHHNPPLHHSKNHNNKTNNSEVMMVVGRQKVAEAGLSDHITFEYQDCTALTYPDNSFDAVTAAFGVRNFENIEQGITEMYRVLKPGGHLMILELSSPEHFPKKHLYNIYSKVVIPPVGRQLSKEHTAYSYLPASIKVVPQGKVMTDLLSRVGFSEARSRTFTFGICSLYTGSKGGSQTTTTV